MTVPAVAAARRVRLQISEEAILALLRLPEGASLLGAETEQWRGPRLVLHLEMPGAPEGADEVHPYYERDPATGDPVRLASLAWLREGEHVATTFPAAQGA